MVNVVAVAMVSLSSTFSSLFAGSDGSARDPPQGSGRPPLRRLAFGMLGTVYVCLLLVAIFVLAVGIGVGLVSLWLEEPVMLSQPLHFDYTDAHPSGVVSLSYAPASGAAPKKRPIPLGHTFRVSLVLVLPESTFNLRLGVFQVAAEIISPDGDVLASSTQPCMLRFKSLPVRIMRTLLMGMPHVLGISCETQKIILGILEYKEKNPRTEAIKVRLKPRSGTYDIPQLYSSEILLNSRLPWGKNLAYNWKWTFYVWVSLYVYIILLTALLCCCKPFIFPRRLSDQGSAPIVAEKDLRSYREDGELSDESSADVKRRADRLRRKGSSLSCPGAHQSLRSVHHLTLEDARRSRLWRMTILGEFRVFSRPPRLRILFLPVFLADTL
ncbi:unnamed protein product [Spirodela intermedia]|uniref:Uncharacterized protein n=1 Tax=Spirodela intermedia TaxID=51605 RepID=A0A7I8JDT4_SPIIN|nr:unnamed protein product [Spirodela intermedia]CAA6668171.1 unnamed protein product [Spirodela intermedia]